MKEKRTNRRYDGAEKVAIVEAMHREGLSYAETARRYNVSCDSMVLYWDRIYQAQGAQALKESGYGKTKGIKRIKRGEYEPKENTEALTKSALLKENERLRAEVAYLKKLRALVQEEERQQRERK